MYHHAKRPTPTLWSVAGGVCALGVVAVIARVLDNYTSFTIAQPFDGLTFVVAVVCLLGGPTMLAWLRGATLKQDNAELKAENQRLHKERDERESLAEAIRRCDQEVEVVKVKVDKALKMLEEKQIPVGDTQEIPKPRLHGLPGGGGA